jgi:hypothetical protein
MFRLEHPQGRMLNSQFFQPAVQLQHLFCEGLNAIFVRQAVAERFHIQERLRQVRWGPPHVAGYSAVPSFIFPGHFFQDHSCRSGILRSNGGRQAGKTGPDDDHIDFPVPPARDLRGSLPLGRQDARGRRARRYNRSPFQEFAPADLVFRFFANHFCASTFMDA